MTREEAIQRIKIWHLDDDDMEVLSVVIPELAESEDERIRKRICLCLDECVHSDIIRDYERDECLAYLEKQKEQQPAGGSSEKPNHQWKPSEEQMKALNEIINILAVSMNPHENDYLFNMINGLRKSLKKL